MTAIKQGNDPHQLEENVNLRIVKGHSTDSCFIVTGYYSLFQFSEDVKITPTNLSVLFHFYCPDYCWDKILKYA